MSYALAEFARRNWRWLLALLIFALGFVGLLSGVAVSERPLVEASSALTKAYYALGLFVVGGLDLGTPEGGPPVGRAMLWLAYFAAPLLTASALIEAVIRVIAPHRWELNRLRDHVVVAGTGVLSETLIRQIRRHSRKRAIVVVSAAADRLHDDELRSRFGAKVIHGDICAWHVLESLKLHRARRVLLLGPDNLESYEAATRMLARWPKLAGRIVLHAPSIRFLRAMAGTATAAKCIVFNSYHLAARRLVEHHMLQHFHATDDPDVVVIAGFGLFGQTVLEELQSQAPGEFDTVAIIDLDAKRRVLVAEEQRSLRDGYRLEVLEGDVSHPDVWARLRGSIDLSKGRPTVLMSTGVVAQNLRTALWLKARHPNVEMFVRSQTDSVFAAEVAAAYDLHSFGINQLVETGIPSAWLADEAAQST